MNNLSQTSGSLPTYKNEMPIIRIGSSDSISSAHYKRKTSERKPVDGIVGIPWTVFGVIDEVENNPTLSDDEIIKKFVATGYDYAVNLAKYHIHKRNNQS